MQNFACLKAEMVRKNNGQRGLGFTPVLTKYNVPYIPQLYNRKALEQKHASFVSQKGICDTFVGNELKGKGVVKIPTNPSYVLKQGKNGKIEAKYVGPQHEKQKLSGVWVAKSLIICVTAVIHKGGSASTVGLHNIVNGDLIQPSELAGDFIPHKIQVISRVAKALNAKNVMNQSIDAITAYNKLNHSNPKGTKAIWVPKSKN
jgi:hypothetical protein